MSTTLDTALALHAAGASVVRAAADGTKAPLGGWKRYQHERADEPTVRAWFASGHPGVGVITGAVSGNLELVEFEGRAVDEGLVAEYADIADASGLGDVWRALTTGYLERTPSGGLHLLYRVTDGVVLPNTKLARRPATADELAVAPGAKVQVLVETRGEGGFVVVAPSHGPVHPTGGAWTLLSGGPATIPTLTGEERDAMHDIARMLDRQPRPEPPAPAPQFTQPAAGRADDGTLRPGDDYEQRTTWDEILAPRGWTRLHTGSDGTTYWRRPGKRIGVSATTGHDPARDRLFVFSSSTEFEQEKPYNRFGALAHLEFGGDHSAAARALRARGYGTPTTTVSARRQHLAAVPEPRPAVDGTAALDTDDAWSAPDEPPVLLPVPMPAREWDDIGNAERVVDRYGHDLRWITDTEQWAYYQGGRWILRGANTGVWTRVVDALSNLVDEEANYSDTPPDTDAKTPPPSEREKFREWARKQRMRPKLAAAREILQAQTEVHTTMDVFDRPEMLLNVGNGIVDLTTGRLRAHDRAQYLMQQTAVRYHPHATSPMWDRFLASVMPDPDRRAYLARVVGYTLTGSTQEQVMFIHHGDGQNGKGVFMRVLMALLGDYAQGVPRSTLLAKQHEGIPNDIARMIGKRLLSTTETSAGKKLDDELVKQLTGEDTVSARFMHAEFFDFRPVGKIHLATNHLPEVGGGHGITRRLQDIGWDITVPPEKRIPKLDEKIMASEAAGVLNWAIRGCLEWQRIGLAVPESVLAKTRDHIASSNPLAAWMDEETEPDPQAATENGQLYGAYKAWAERFGSRPITGKAFAMVLAEKGYEQGKHPRTRRAMTIGLRLTSGRTS